MTDAALESVTIRMYRGILGDCFLLRLRLSGEETRCILIDCGVLQNVADGATMRASLPREVVEYIEQTTSAARLDAVEAGPAQIRRVVADLVVACGGVIDRLIITHEHYDHLSGFALAWEAFATVEIKELWLAWTEDPADAQAQTLRTRMEKGRHAVALAARAAVQPALAGDERLQTVAALAAFLGPDPTFAAAGTMTVAETLEALKKKAGKVRYLQPGQILGPRDTFGLTTYVLGPPRDEVMLRKDGPSAGVRKEVYLTDLDTAAAVEGAARARLVELKIDAGPTSPGDDGPAIPFARPHYRRTPIPGDRHPEGSPEALYYDPSAKWREVGEAWTGAAEALALKLDSDTNNTSLALAFALPDERMLLFPGDAQVGNWLSWGAQTYPPNPKPNQPALDIDTLLSRVVFYKVGHHGSHNATLEARGLEKMTDRRRLIAAIPVVEAVAQGQGRGRTVPGKGWQMPYGPLRVALERVTEGRIVAGDGDPVSERQAFDRNPSDPNPVTLDYGPDKLWVEVAFTA